MPPQKVVTGPDGRPLDKAGKPAEGIWLQIPPSYINDLVECLKQEFRPSQGPYKLIDELLMLQAQHERKMKRG